VTALEPVVDAAGEVYSSTRVRNHLVHAAPRRAAELLGRPWEIEGPVLEGDRRGRTIGFPTANIGLGEYLRPVYGIYAVRAATADGAVYDGVANLGIRPMWQTAEPMLEAHLFGFTGDLYGRKIRVQLIDFLRPEAKFDSVEALVAQMDRDAAAARAALAGISPAPAG
jgi:riboflavin kinase/FMN adenylyltransferase